MNRKLRAVIIVIMALLISGGAFAFAWFIGVGFFGFVKPVSQLTFLIAVPVAFFLLGLLVSGYILDGFVKLADKTSSKLFRMPLQDVISGVLGLIIGLLIASLINSVFSNFRIVGSIISVLCTVFLGYLGWLVGYKRKDDLVHFFNTIFRSKDKALRPEVKGKAKANYKILDTSVIIDGRIADIARSGFLEGTFVIANFVLDELRHIADSADLLKRNRGRRGLDILKKLQEEFEDRVLIVDTDYPEITEVDSKLVRLTQDMAGAILTNDFNLNKVAQLQGVLVLNINELSNAVKPVLLPGESLPITIIKAGKEQNQGVAYLDDGTMIVVENGQPYIDENIEVEVTSVLQTSAGRMIFGRPLKRK